LVAVPDIDLAASAAFHDPVEGFVGRKAWFAEAIRTVARLIEALALSAFLGPLAVKLVWPESRLLVRPRAALFAAATLLLGPGLLVNAILKDHWGRARPHTVEAFGGEAAFTRAWEMSDACERNCSFVGGEAASAVWLVAVALLAPAPWRGRLIALALAVTAAVSLARLAAGGHFLSDILIGACLTLLVIAALHAPIMQRLPPAFDAQVEAWLARAGRRLRRLVPDRS
jgi:membrane-associated PAP2 superfamily phosphatase